MMGIKNAWLREKTAQIYIFQKGQLVLTMKTAALDIVVWPPYIEIHHKHPMGISYPPSLLAGISEVNISIFDGDKLLESWTLPNAKWGGGSLSHKPGKHGYYGFYILTSSYAKRINSKYMR